MNLSVCYAMTYDLPTIYAGDSKYVVETVIYEHTAGFLMIDQNSISDIVQGSILFGCARVMG